MLNKRTSTISWYSLKRKFAYISRLDLHLGVKLVDIINIGKGKLTVGREVTCLLPGLLVGFLGKSGLVLKVVHFLLFPVIIF